MDANNVVASLYILLIAYIWYRTTISRSPVRDLLIKTVVALVGAFVLKGLMADWFI